MARLSPIAEPVITRSPATTGGEVTAYWPGSVARTSRERSTAPLSPKSAQGGAGRAVERDQPAVERADEDPSAQGAPGGASGSRQAATPREVASA